MVTVTLLAPAIHCQGRKGRPGKTPSMNLPRLSETALNAVRPGILLPGYDRNAARIGIVHIGPGAFHRVHQAAYADALLHRDPRWAISALSLKSSGLQDALAPQDCLYTLTELSDHRCVRVIGAIREVLTAAREHAAAFARLTASDTRMVTLTVTEKGYCLNSRAELDASHPDILHDWQSPSQPRSVIGWLIEALRRRRSSDTAPFAIVSCDNLANNGWTLRNALVAFAARSDEKFARWIEANLSCPRTMVDSITPATDDALRECVAAASGVIDAWPVQRENFTQWIVEDMPAMHEADWRSVGVTLTADVGIYDRAKLRLVNGGHSTLAYVGLLCGHASVREAMDEPLLANFVATLMREDIAPSLKSTREFAVDNYIDTVLARFRNPGVRHLLAQIAWDGSKKLPVRIMGTIAQALQAGRPVHRLAVPVAAWMRFVAAQVRAGKPIVDPDAKLLASIGMACRGDALHDIGLFATATSVIDPALWSNAAFRYALQSAYDALIDPLAALQST